MLKAIKDSNSKYEGAKYRENNQIESPYGIYTKCGSLIQQLQNFTHPFLNRVSEIVRDFRQGKFDIIANARKHVFSPSTFVIRIGVLVPFISVTETSLA